MKEIITSCCFCAVWYDLEVKPSEELAKRRVKCGKCGNISNLVAALYEDSLLKCKRFLENKLNKIN